MQWNAAKSLNPFMNQVYFYREALLAIARADCPGLNPFMNQVYFYIVVEEVSFSVLRK